MTMRNSQQSGHVKPGALLMLCILAITCIVCGVIAYNGHGLGALILLALIIGALGANVEPFDALDD